MTTLGESLSLDKFLVKVSVKSEEIGLDLFYFSFHFLFSVQFIFPFSIFRTTRVRVDWSRCHISHNLMA